MPKMVFFVFSYIHTQKSIFLLIKRRKFSIFILKTARNPYFCPFLNGLFRMVAQNFRSDAKIAKKLP